MTDCKGKLIMSNEDVNNNNGSKSENVRVNDKYPWVISFPQRRKLIELFDPLEQKMYTLDLPEIVGTNVCYSKDGWLLMHRSSFVDLFFFSPYTRELISLPECKLSFQAIAFSSAPTSSTCVLVALYPKTKDLVEISVWYSGATEWITKKFPCSVAFDCYMHSNLAYANDHFYCVTSTGVLFEFDPASLTLNHQAVDEHRCPYIHNDEWLYQPKPKRMYLMEQKGALFLMYTYGSETPMVYKLVSSKWEEISSATLDGLTIFASCYSSETRMDVLEMRNSVYFPMYGLHNLQCVSYSFGESKYYPRKPLLKSTESWHFQKELCSLESLWIEPPSKDVVLCERAKRSDGKGYII